MKWGGIVEWGGWVMTVIFDMALCQMLFYSRYIVSTADSSATHFVTSSKKR